MLKDYKWRQRGIFYQWISNNTYASMWIIILYQEGGGKCQLENIILTLNFQTYIVKKWWKYSFHLAEWSCQYLRRRKLYCILSFVEENIGFTWFIQSPLPHHPHACVLFLHVLYLAYLLFLSLPSSPEVAVPVSEVTDSTLSKILLLICCTTKYINLTFNDKKKFDLK